MNLAEFFFYSQLMGILCNVFCILISKFHRLFFFFFFETEEYFSYHDWLHAFLLIFGEFCSFSLRPIGENRGIFFCDCSAIRFSLQLGEDFHNLSLRPTNKFCSLFKRMMEENCEFFFWPSHFFYNWKWNLLKVRI